ncbi:hypothetical protein [Kitasatospora viridis]|uniref:Uncharacterized protein n=1 Tax=Kitasatospora viridis TaxID=281105 RepID=A0A561UPJ7_9ACTN|nr:hypothetical protein [Kitasatospora viridis]TWG01271.1 hypothetical protein FHX73_115163 [Kitasatospora viridis]
MACGTVKELNAAQKVSAAFQKLGESKDLGIKLSLDVTPDQLTAYTKATGEKMDPKAVQALAGLSISVGLHADKPLKDVKALNAPAGSTPDPQAEAELKQLTADYLIADRTGAALLELRQVGGVTYLHGDLTAVAKLTGEDPDQMRKGLDEAGDQLGPIKDALNGGWVEFDPQTLKDFGAKAAAGASAAPGAPSAVPSVDPKTGQDAFNSLKNMLSGDFSFESLGKKDGADEIRVSLSVRKLAEDVLKAFKPVADKLPKEAAAGFPTSVPSDVPDKTVSAELAIKNGSLASATFDLAQLDSKAPSTSYLPLKLAFDQSAPAVQAPANATKLTEQDLEKAFTAMAGMRQSADGSGGAGGPGALPGTPAPTLTDAQVQELAQKTGEPADSIRAMNRLGFGYDDILAMAQDDNNQA